MAESIIAMLGVYAMSYVSSYAQKQIKKQIFGKHDDDNNDTNQPKVVLIPPMFDRRIDRCQHARLPLVTYTRHRYLLFNHLFNNDNTLSAVIRMQPTEYEGDLSTNTDILQTNNVGLNSNETTNINTDFAAHLYIPYNATTTQSQQQFTSKSLSGDAIFHISSMNNAHNTFGNLKFSTHKGGYSRLLSSINLFNNNNIDVSAIINLPSVQSNTTLQQQLYNDARIGLRFDTHNVSPAGSVGSSSIGLHVNPYQDNTVGTWLCGYSSHLRGGIEYKYNPIKHYDYISAALYYSPVNNNLSKYTAEQPDYELGLQLDFNEKKLTASYYHHMVVRRHIYNPFEKNTVVGINNYIDLGVELTQYINATAQQQNNDNKSIVSSSIFNTLVNTNDNNNTTTPDLTAAVSWQINRNSMIKARLNHNTVSAVYAFKSWFQPSAIISLSGHYNIDTGKQRIGTSIMLDNVASILYDDTAKSYRRVIGSKVKDVTREYQLDPNY